MIVGNVLETLLLALQGCRDVVGNEQNKNFIKSLSSGLQSLHTLCTFWGGKAEKIIL